MNSKVIILIEEKVKIEEVNLSDEEDDDLAW